VRTAWLVECGRIAYDRAWRLQQALVSARQEERTPDIVLFAEHPPVITVGRTGRASNILASREILAARGVEIYDVERGGDVTYHGPGQLVGYPIVDLRALDEDVVRYMRLLESALISAVGAWGIVAERRRGYPGAWAGGAKIAAIGVAVKRKVTMHGFALNVDPDLSSFDLINPCGLGRPVTSMARLLGRSVTLEDVRPVMARALGEALQMTLTSLTSADLAAHLSEAAAVLPH
jgi:lipoate-protein ligase B